MPATPVTTNLTAEAFVPPSDEVKAAAGRHARMPELLIRDSKLPDRAKVLYAEMRLYAWESIGSECFASQPRLAKDLGWSVDKVQRAAKELADAGLVKVTRTGRLNSYALIDRRIAVSDTADPRQQIPQNCGTEADDAKPDERKQQLVAAAVALEDRIGDSGRADEPTGIEESEPRVNGYTGRQVLERYERVVFAAGRKPRTKPGDEALALALFDEYGPLIGKALRFALADVREPNPGGWDGWHNKVLSFGAFAKNLPSIVNAMPAEQPVRDESTFWGMRDHDEVPA